MHSKPISTRSSSARPLITRRMGTYFVGENNYCNGGSTSTNCDGMLRIADQGGTRFGFNTIDPTFAPGTAKLEIPIQPKAIHDEMNAAAFDEFGRMTANIGVEVPLATPAGQNIVLYPYVNPPTEICGCHQPAEKCILRHTCQ